MESKQISAVKGMTGSIGNQFRQAKPVRSNKNRARPLRKVSKAQASRLRKYYKLRKAFLAEHPVCQIYACGDRSFDIHHKHGRGPNLLRIETFMAVCRACHQFIHDFPSIAREHGLLK